jgi:hypothetical protein
VFLGSTVVERYSSGRSPDIKHVERGEQGDSALALVIMTHGVAAPRLDRLGAIERFDLALFR